MATRNPRAPRLMVEISRALIDEAIPADSSHCMIAEAIKAAVPEATHVSVDLQTVRFTDRKKGLRYTYLTPRIAQVALVNFDQGRHPDPFTIRLRNGQVTASGRKSARSNPAPDLTPAQLASTRKATKASQDAAKKLRETRLVQRSDGTVPDRVGGRTPPSTPFARRRAFGLRALER